MTQYTSENRRRYNRAMIAWFGAMQDAYNRLSDGDRRSLECWEQEHLGGGDLGTSDWPGWKRYIGSRPAPPPLPHRPAYWPLRTRKRVRR